MWHMQYGFGTTMWLQKYKKKKTKAVVGDFFVIFAAILLTKTNQSADNENYFAYLH